MKNIFHKTAIISAFVVVSALAAFSQTTTFSKIEEMPGWSTCSSCAGANGSGPVASFSLKQGISVPSMDGKSIQFFLGGSTPYSNALYSKKLLTSASTASSKSHFIYDTYFYYKNASAVQGMEFNTSQYFGGKGFIFGVQCDVRSSGTWEISVPDGANSSLAQMHWSGTGIACPAPPTYKWNHLVLEYERTPDNKVHYISLTFNGVKKYVNKYYARRIAPSSWGGITTHYQLNGNSKQDDYYAWIDQYKVTMW
jgi:hypothetical protein